MEQVDNPMDALPMPHAKILLVMAPLCWPKMPPIGLGYLQAHLEKEGLRADILDLNNIFYNCADGALKKEWMVSCNAGLENAIFGIMKERYPAEFKKNIERMLDYEVIGFSCFKSNLNASVKLAALVKCNNKKIVFGGPEITRQFFKYAGAMPAGLDATADFLVAGEGEEPLLRFMQGKGGGKIAAFEQAADMSDCAFPRYRGLRFGSYPKKEAAPVQFSRGCIRRCSFCAERLLYKGFRRRKTESVLEEMDFHKTRNKVSSFVFFDSMLNADLAALEALCDGIIRRFGSLPWEAQVAVRNDMGDELLRKMKESGCYNLFVGLESGSGATLQKMNKGFCPQEAEDFFKRLCARGLSFGISMIVGYPGETQEDFLESMAFVTRNKDFIPKIEQVNPFVYYEGIPASPAGDYALSTVSLSRMEQFVSQIKRRGFKYTNAFLGNLIEKNDRV